MRVIIRTVSLAAIAAALVCVPGAGPAAVAAQDTTACDSCTARALRDLARQIERLRLQYDSASSVEARRAMERAMRDLSRERANVMAAQRAQISMMQRPSGWLGVMLSGQVQFEQKDGRELMRYLEYPVIETVEAASPAERAGVEAQDRLLSLDGQDVTQGTEPFAKLLRPGRRLTLRVRRGDTDKTLNLTVGRRPMGDAGSWSFRFTEPPRPPEPWSSTGAVTVPVAPLPPMITLEPDPSHVMIEMRGPESAAVAGARVQRMVDDLRDYFGVRDGLLVLEVLRGTPAQRAGLRGGDVIVKADGRLVASPMALAHVLERSSDRVVKLDVVRKRKPLAVTLRWDQ